MQPLCSSKEAGSPAAASMMKIQAAWEHAALRALENLVAAQKVDRSLVDELHTRLHRAIVCRGEAECTASLSTSSGT